MKFILLFLFPFQASALTCFDSSSGLLVSLARGSGQVRFQFSSGRGYEFIPQVEGPVSKADQAMIKFQTESLKGLGSQFEVSMPEAACDLKRAQEGIFACYQEGAIPGTDLRVSSLTGYKVKQSHVSGEFEMRNFRLIIGKEDRFFFLIPFASHACEGDF